MEIAKNQIWISRQPERLHTFSKVMLDKFENNYVTFHYVTEPDESYYWDKSMFESQFRFFG